ncbi:MAG: BatA and WFA domain-containing protein [Phycisphaerales bacterium]|nr:MAG: BatA and WFA domain-containing protein [Phycisphaerales bacterium]
MTFLSPGAAILAAAIAGPLLLAIYVLKLRRRPVRVSSVVFWDEATRDLEANVPFRRLRSSLLLIIQALVLACLVLAAGRPVIGSSSGERLVLVIDASASMSARDGPNATTRLDEAKRVALRVARSNAGGMLSRISGGGGSVCIVRFAADAEVLQAFTSSTNLLRTSIDGIESTDQAGDLASALSLARSLATSVGPGSTTGDMESAGDIAAGARIIVITDDDAAIPMDPAIEALSVAPPAAEARPTPPPGVAPHNTGIVGLSAARRANDPTNAILFIDVLSTAREPRVVECLVLVDGRDASSASIKIPAASDKPARSSAMITIPLPRGGLVTARLAERDLLESDNASSILVREPLSPTIAVVRVESTQTVGLGWALRDVLEELRPKRLDILSPTNYLEASTKGAIHADLVVFDGWTPPSPALGASLSFGSTGAIPGVIATPLDARATRSVVLWERDHPALRTLSLDGIIARMDTRWSLDAYAAPEWTLRDLATTSDGPMIIEGDHARDRHIACVFRPELSNWPLQPGFALFVASAVEYLTLDRLGGVSMSYTTSDLIRIDAGEAPITIDGPITRTIDAGAPMHAQRTLGTLPKAGVYTATTGGKTTLIPVNLESAAESSIPLTFRERADNPRRASRSEDDRSFWPSFVLLALALLGVEWLIYAKRTRV